ncbi:MAG: RnfABCDGE type electron transport complex subunit D [Bacteroides sp.]|nr:RnfABCDGE type electron transport complex subunit D [Eubacterium sp.]MCM1418788.1 RnfABCDGE type electron transport complex subunit D [Roseburia sp.]MCM1462445.1 RnfABCDGE type electron transport complex subunit D [Bacteroides sp.]
MSDRKNELFEKFDTSVKTPVLVPKKARKQKSIYSDQLLCLLPLLGLGIWQSGIRALAIAIVSVFVCMLSDLAFCRMSKKTYNPRDLSTLASGLCIALMMPASVSLGIVACGAFLAMGIKHIFGGKDNYIFNPTAAAIAFLIICFPGEMLLYPPSGVRPALFNVNTSELVSGIESYLIKIGTAPSVSLQDLLIGNYVGPLGTTHFLVLAVCGVCLLARRSMSLLVTVSGLGSYFALTALFPVYNRIGDTVILELIGGYLLFGFVFLVSDPQTLPKTAAARIPYGILIGVLGCLFRHFGKVEGSFLFVLLIANALALNLDELCASALAKLRRAISYLFRNIDRYEKLRKTAEDETAQRKLTDTMEIIVPQTNYNMPPIDGKVTKIKRGKTNPVSRFINLCKIRIKKELSVRRSRSKNKGKK